MEGIASWITVSQHPGWIIRVTVVFGDTVKFADIEVVFNKYFREALDIEGSRAPCHAVLVGRECHMRQRIFDIEIIAVPAGGKSH